MKKNNKPALAYCQNCKAVRYQTICGDRDKPEEKWDYEQKAYIATVILKCNGCGKINLFGAEKESLGVGLKGETIK